MAASIQLRSVVLLAISKNDQELEIGLKAVWCEL